MTKLTRKLTLILIARNIALLFAVYELYVHYGDHIGMIAAVCFLSLLMLFEIIDRIAYERLKVISNSLMDLLNAIDKAVQEKRLIANPDLVKTKKDSSTEKEKTDA